MRYEGTSTRVARIQDTDDTKRWRCGAARTLIHCQWGCSLVRPLGRRGGQFLTKINLSYHTLQWSCSLVFIQIHWRLVHTKTCMRIFTEALSAIVKKLKATQMSFSGWRGKQAVIGPDNGALFSAKKKWAVKSQKETWRNLKCIVLSEISQF